MGKQQQKQQRKKKLRIDENGTLLIDPPTYVNANRENYQRLNYLYQLSTWSTLMTSNVDNGSMARMYNKNLDLISKKVKCNVSPDIKRGICKKCNRRLIPTRTCKIILQNKSKKKTSINDDFVIKCQCGTEKVFRIGLNREYNSFYKRSLVQMP